jgi:thymidylate synthase (FAD)
VLIITEPSVHVLSLPQFFPHPRYKLPTRDGDFSEFEPTERVKILQGTPCEQIIAHAGKGCYDSYGEDGRDIDKHIITLINSGHGSVLEHANVTLFIEGISRGCSHEFVRHRAGFAYSQRSTRYVDEGECAIVLEPYMAEIHRRYCEDGELSVDEEQIYVEYLKSVKNSGWAYKKAVALLMELAPKDMEKRDKRKWARGKARQLLPIALETRMTVTANLRAWRHFLVQRSSRFAEPEIRRLSNIIFPILYSLAPTVFQDFMQNAAHGGFVEYTSNNPKV